MFTGLLELLWRHDCTAAALWLFVPFKEIQIAFVTYSHLLVQSSGVIIKSGI